MGDQIGLESAWENGFRQVYLESDSLTGLELIRKAPPDSPHLSLILSLRNLLGRDWECSLKHTWREGNQSADQKFSLDMQVGVHKMIDPPASVKPILGQDILGVAVPRIVKL